MVKSKKDFRKNDKKIKIVTEKDNKPLTRRKNLDKKN